MTTMTVLDQNPAPNPKSKGKSIFVLGALMVMIGFAVGLSYSNTQNREIFQKKVEKIILTDKEFVKKNDCWLLDQKPNEKLNVNSVEFFGAKNSKDKNFHYKCADDRGYESNVYVGSQDAQYLSDNEKLQLTTRLESK